mgnify:CR=1 FL=1
MNIQKLIEQYANLNRLVGDYRRELNRSEHGTRQYVDALEMLRYNEDRMVLVENQLEDMGLLNTSDRYTDRGVYNAE